MITTEGISINLVMARNQFCFAIDRGGTFTDVYALCPGGKVGQITFEMVIEAFYITSNRYE